MTALICGNLRRKVRDARKTTERLIVRQQEVMRVADQVVSDMKDCKHDLLQLQKEATGLMETLTIVLEKKAAKDS